MQINIQWQQLCEYIRIVGGKRTVENRNMYNFDDDPFWWDREK